MSESEREQKSDDRQIEVSVVLPCLNESQSLGGCIATLKCAFKSSNLVGEIIVADNGSSDGSQEIANRSGARLVSVMERGYGNALRGGIEAAKGTYIIFADSDGSYDFNDVPRFVQRLREGNDLVMGNRFAGKIHDGAMPWLHRYIGNPVLSGIGRVLFRVRVGDFHCGIRGFSKVAYDRLELCSTGMEFASELVIRAANSGLRICELPVELRPDGRDRPPHLRTWRDGWRHLRLMLLLFVQRLGWREWFTFLAVVFVAMLLVAQIWRSGWCNDESAHIPAGLYHLETGRMDAYRVNPPLPRMLAALPLLIDHPKLEWFSMAAPHARNEYVFAQNWIQANLTVVPRQLRQARGVMILFFALGAWTIYKWTIELYGKPAAGLALALWSLSPDVITYSATVAPDLPAAATGLFACYMFWKWLFGGKNEVPWEVCFGLGMATLSKFSWLFLFVLFPLLTLMHDLSRSSAVGVSRSVNLGNAERFRFAAQRVGKLLIALLGTVLMINLIYGFEGTGRRLGEFEFLSATLGGEHESRFDTGNRFRGTLLSALPMPLPCEMLQGLDYLKWEFEIGYPCYLLGQWKDRGWWYFYLVAMAVKFPVGYIVLMLVGSGALTAGFFKRRSIQGEWFVPLIGLLFIAQVSSQTGFTHHLRYVLPAFGFLYILAARSVTVLPQRVVALTVCLCLIGSVVFHVTHIGLAHTHINWLAGGPENGWRYLGLSNLDWGQSTYRMAGWARSHSELRPLTVVFVSELGDPSRLVSDLNIATRVRFESQDVNGHAIPSAGWYLMSSKQLAEEQNAYFRNVKPASWPFADVALFRVEEDALLP